MGEASFQFCALWQVAGLIRRPGTQPRNAWTRREIRVGLGAGHALDKALDPDLAAQRFPVEQQRSLRIGRYLVTLPALRVGVEHEASRIGALQQYDTRRWYAVRGRGGERHGVGVFRLLGPGLLHPVLEFDERVG